MRPVLRGGKLMLVAPAAGMMSIVFVGACDSPSAPSQRQLEIVGARALAPGETAQFQAFVVMSGGSRLDVTARTAWSSSDPAVLSAASGGVLTGGKTGDAVVRVTYEEPFQGDLSAANELTVVPRGTFKLSGLVTSSFANPSTGVTVELVGPDGDIRIATSDRDGFRFHGVAGRVQLKASIPLHHAYRAEIDIHDHLRHDIRLLPINLSGTYTLTLSASASCRSLLPEAMRSRSYGATIVQEDSHGLLNVTLHGAEFGGTPRFGGALVGGDGVWFNIIGGVDRDPWVAEQIGTQSWFVVYGEMRGSHTRDRLAGTLNGGMYVESWESGQRTVAECKATDHEMVFSR